uniref:Uncharacterized protein n=1 Tax=viral metagenome TaxID=1070528 RepID=A0A6C0AG03_9ZZZZ|tara:strand:+ start:6395 stop:7207 length:813 start_codon:yes stop_codon:yes gene_type:complete
MVKNGKYKKNKKTIKNRKRKTMTRRRRTTKRGGMDTSPSSSLDNFSDDGMSATTMNSPQHFSRNSFGSLGSLGSFGSLNESAEFFGPAVFSGSVNSAANRPDRNRFATSSPSIQPNEYSRPPLDRFATRSPSIAYSESASAEAYRRGPNADPPLPKDQNWKILFTIEGVAVYMTKQNEKLIFQLQRPGDIRDIKNTALFKKIEMVNRKIARIQESEKVEDFSNGPWNKFLTPEGINVYYSLTNDMNVDNIKVIPPSFSGNPEYDINNIQL